MNPFAKNKQKKQKELVEKIEQDIDQRITEDKQRIIEHILDLEEYYYVETLGELQLMSLTQLVMKFEKYLQALKDDIGE